MQNQPHDTREGGVSARLSVAKWGGVTRLIVNTVVSTTAARTRFLVNNPKRIACTFQNSGVSMVMFGPNISTLATDGYMLAPGAVCTLHVDEDGELITSEWWFRSVAAIPAQVTITEVELK